MKNFKKILFIIIGIVIVGGIGALYYSYYQSQNYFVTDNAKITAKMVAITSAYTGELKEWRVKEGDYVEKNTELGIQENAMPIKAPINGEIIRTNVIVDQVIVPGMEMATIADSANTYIGANIEETDISKISEGQKVDVKIDAYPGIAFSGYIKEIGAATPAAFSQTMSFNTSGTYTKVVQLIPVKIALYSDNERPLILGMNAEVKIHLK
ncbi:MAG: multidrug resistance efflux pump [Clostridia bacterium]|jgi:multidrug resistance efflux pump|nr:multidrug resistance efflux pump [Clostridia bacterium]